jgi:hypothetical protein
MLNGEKFDNWQTILQQWWEIENITDALHNNILDGEWRDVPLENEA